jgi:carboxylate-amine ligase
MILQRDWLADAPTDTFGVEEEFYLVDRATGELADRARDVVAVSDGPDLDTDVLRCTVVSSTPACTTSLQCAQALMRQRDVLIDRAERLGLELHAAGVPPMLRREELRSRVDPAHPRARHAVEAQAAADLDVLACHGIHVHVGVRDFDRALTVMDALLSQLPLLTALTANSRLNAFGADCASLRTALLLRSPFVGMTPRFTDVADLQCATASSAPDRTGQPRPRWIIAPAPHYGTVELRAFDSNADVRVGTELALVSRAIADAALDGVAFERPSEREARATLQRALTFGVGDDGLAERWHRLMSLLDGHLLEDVPWLSRRMTAVDGEPLPTLVSHQSLTG